MSGIGSRIKLARKMAKLKQHHLADYLGITVQSVSQYESGQTDIGISKLIKIAEFLNVTLEFLVNDDNTGIKDPNQLREAATKYHKPLQSEFEYLQKENQILLEFKEKLIEQVETQSKLISAYESGYVPKSVPKSIHQGRQKVYP